MMSELDLRKCQQSDHHIADRLRELVSEWAGASIAYRMEIKKLYSEAGQLKAELVELAKLQAERDPVDNGDGTVTALLPVTYPKGLPVEQARSPKAGDKFVSDGGEILNSTSGLSRNRIRLILRPAPQPPEPVTWEAPLVDGVWHAQGATFSTDAGRVVFTWDCTGEKIRGITKPAKLGRYQFRDGVGTLIEAAQ